MATIFGGAREPVEHHQGSLPAMEVYSSNLGFIDYHMWKFLDPSMPQFPHFQNARI